MNVFLRLLFVFSLSLFIGCEDEIDDNTPNYTPPTYELKIILSNNCQNLFENNRVSVNVTKVGGGYSSGDFWITEFGSSNGITLDVGSEGNYNIVGVGISDSFFGSNSNWEFTTFVEENVKKIETLSCN